MWESKLFSHACPNSVSVSVYVPAVRSALQLCADDLKDAFQLIAGWKICCLIELSVQSHLRRGLLLRSHVAASAKRDRLSLAPISIQRGAATQRLP